MKNREQVYQALFDLASGAAKFLKTSRKLIPVDNVQASDMPTLCQAQMGETVVKKRGIPAKYTMHVDLWVYAMGNDSTEPSSILNPLVSAIEDVLDPLPGNEEQTLGLSNVSHCFINGKVEMFENVLNNTIVAIIPVEILAT